MEFVMVMYPIRIIFSLFVALIWTAVARINMLQLPSNATSSIVYISTDRKRNINNRFWLMSDQNRQLIARKISVIFQNKQTRSGVERTKQRWNWSSTVACSVCGISLTQSFACFYIMLTRLHVWQITPYKNGHHGKWDRAFGRCRDDRLMQSHENQKKTM